MTKEEAYYYGYERTPLWLRLLGKPRWRIRLWRYQSNLPPIWIYED